MRLTTDQELRKELLLFAMSKLSDVEAAIDMAARMERFVLDGCQPCDGRRVEAATTDQASSPGVPAAGDTRPAPAGDLSAESGRKQVAGAEETKARKRRWSEADDRQFKTLWRSALSLEEIAAELDRTTPSLYCRARALGLPRRDSISQVEQRPTAAAAALEERNADPEPTHDQNGSASAPSSSTGEKIVGETLPQQIIKHDRYDAKEADHAAPSGGVRRGFGSNRGASTGAKASCGSAQVEVSEFFVDPIIQFLRSRDYSVVRVGSGQFKLDGRRVLNADELRQKANTIRKSLGQPPFAAELHGPIS